MTLNISKLELDGRTIVIVEDDLPSIRYYETVLKNTGAELMIFRTGKEFVDYISQKESKADMVFMDFLIPLVNGIECVKLLRRERKNVPVIMITAFSSEQVKTEAYIAGCNEYILKPIYPEKIFNLVARYLNTSSTVTLR
jgi:CheY-like chemotaxis protein